MAALLVVALGVAPTFHFVWKHEVGTQLLWRDSEAFLAIQTRQDGWRGGTFGLIWQVFRNTVQVNTATTHAIGSLEMFRFDRGGLHRTTVRDVRVTQFVPVDGRLITRVNGLVARWTGDGFEPASDDEAAYFKSGAFPLGHYDNVGGWSHRSLLLHWGQSDTRHRITVAGQQLEIRVQAPSDFSEQKLTLTVGDASPQVIWANRPGRTSLGATEYIKTFRSQQP